VAGVTTREVEVDGELTTSRYTPGICTVLAGSPPAATGPQSGKSGIGGLASTRHRQ
jgi:hypothetical protein